MSKKDEKSKNQAKTSDKAKTTKTKAVTKDESKTTVPEKPIDEKSTSTNIKDKPENTIFVGNKPAMVYVLAIITCFNENKAKEVKICARGRAISTAVDVAELTKNRFLPDIKVKNITTSTEQVVRREGGGEANVSAIEIILTLKP
ncbi:MAG: DNA-binding protein Alba [Candidatus Heimdallarchaeota archaeon]|nr:DNA-binding protein Alba [Candidatus Heimdallarchaeota archaeon]